MLVLTRRTNQRIKIGKDIELVITEVKPDLVRVGIIAPKDVPIFRAEVYEAIERANRDAALAPNAPGISDILQGIVEKSEK